VGSREVAVEDPVENTPQRDVRQQRPAVALAVVGVLVAAPVVALMWVSSYARETPRLWGLPFFYWYQFLWVFLAAGCTYTAYRIVTATDPRRNRTHDRGGKR
jgi:hypothetical protein